MRVQHGKMFLLRCPAATRDVDTQRLGRVVHLEEPPQALCIKAGGPPFLEAAHHVIVQRRLEGLEDGQAPDDGGHELGIRRNAPLLYLHSDIPQTLKQDT